MLTSNSFHVARTSGLLSKRSLCTTCALQILQRRFMFHRNRPWSITNTHFFISPDVSKHSFQVRWNASTSSNAEPPKRKAINVTWYSLAVFFLSSLGGYYIYLKMQEENTLTHSGDRVKALKDAGLGQLDWKLTDQYGRLREKREFHGKWLMLYFGFCHCPDICPEELEKLVNVVSGIDADPHTPAIQPIFITLDPERDTVQYMHKYCKDFSEKLIGLTGSTAEISAAAKSYRVYYSLGPKDQDGDYIVDHTICMYLIDPEGQLVDVYERRATVDGIVKGSLKHMSEHEKLKQRNTKLT